jgi:hypothetical protein
MPRGADRRGIYPAAAIGAAAARVDQQHQSTSPWKVKVLRVSPAKDPALAHTIIYAKFLATLILDDLTGSCLSIFPYSYRLA